MIKLLTRRSIFRYLLPIAALALVVIGLIFPNMANAERQPHMYAALTSLKNAQASLNAALADKGGHRDNALILVDKAIGEVQAGIDYANTH